MALDGAGSRRTTESAKTQASPKDQTNLDDLQHGGACILIRASE